MWPILSSRLTGCCQKKRKIHESKIAKYNNERQEKKLTFLPGRLSLQESPIRYVRKMKLTSNSSDWKKLISKIEHCWRFCTGTGASVTLIFLPRHLSLQELPAKYLGLCFCESINGTIIYDIRNHYLWLILETSSHEKRKSFLQGKVNWQVEKYERWKGSGEWYQEFLTTQAQSHELWV